MSQHVFISYVAADLSWAEWIAWELRQAGFKTTFQAWDFRPGSNLVLEADRATREADRVIAVLSPAYLECRSKQAEWTTAFLSDPLDRKLVPIQVQPCTPSGFLKGIVTIDLVGLDEATARARLGEGLGPGPRIGYPPPFPGVPSEEIKARPDFPGTRTPLGNIPHLPNPHFTGRGELLLKLREKLASGRAAVLTQTLSGLGGVGKTQLAVRYAYEHTREYRLVWWLRAEESAALASDFASLARHLALPEKDMLDQREVIAAARLWLESHEGWLLVFDNAEEPGDLRPYIPRSGSGHVLITSRNPIWRGLADSFAVPLFDAGESLEFLLRTTRQEESDITGSLAEALGHLPLALDQAASYIHATGITVTEYISLFDKYSIHLLSRGEPTTDYPATVATTWEISFDKVRRINPAAEGLLNVFAFLGAEAIPRSLLQAGAANLPEPLRAALTDPLTLHDAIIAIQRYSLVSVQPNGYNIHRLVQSVIQDRLRETGEVWVRAAASLVDAVFPYDHDDPATWEGCRRLLPHAIAVANFRQFDLADAAAEHLFWRVGLYLSERGDFREALRMLEDARRIHETILGPEHFGLSRLLADLALVEQALGKAHAAKRSLTRAIHIQGTDSGRTLEYGILLGQTGLVDLALGQHSSAQKNFEKALELLRSDRSTENLGYAVGLGNLGIALHALGEREAALELQEQALSLLRKARSRHPAVAVVSNNIGILLVDLGRHEAALNHLATAASIDQATYGQKHPMVAIRLANQALVVEICGNGETARDLLESALAQDEAVFGLNHPRVAMDLNSLALRLRTEGDLEGARKLLERAASVLQSLWGETHLDLTLVRINLGHVLFELGAIEEAHIALDRALHAAEVTLGEKHPITARSLNDLGSVLAELGILYKAREYLARADSIARITVKVSPADRAIILVNLGDICESLGLRERARAQYEACLRLAPEAGLLGHPFITFVEGALARVKADCGERPSAIQNLEHAISEIYSTKPFRPIYLALFLNNLAVLLVEEKRTHRARAMLMRALSLFNDQPVGAAANRIRQNLAALDLETKKHPSDILGEDPAVRCDVPGAGRFTPTIAGISLGGQSTWGMPAGNMAGWSLAEPLLRSATCLSFRPVAPGGPSEPQTTKHPAAETSDDVEFFLMRQNERLHRSLRARGVPEMDYDDLIQDIFLDFCGNRNRIQEGTLEEQIWSSYGRVYQRYKMGKARENRHVSPLQDLADALGFPKLEGRTEREIYLSELSELAQDNAGFFDIAEEESSGLSFEDVLWEEQEEPLAMLLRKEQIIVLRGAVRALPTRTRQVLELRLRDLGYREIAERMKVSIDTVKSQLHEARRRLRELLLSWVGNDFIDPP